MKNITNGEFDLDIDGDDRVNENYKFIKAPGGDVFDTLRRANPNIETNYYIENIRTGEYSQISERYKLESQQEKKEEDVFAGDSFEAEMSLLKESIQSQMNKIFTFFQGIWVGMSLLFTITLTLSDSVSTSLVRVQDQSIRILALLSSFGALYSFMAAKQKYDFIKVRGTASQIDQKYKCALLSFIQMILYLISYIIFNISHSYALKYNILQSNYEDLKILTIVYTAVCVIGWVITNANTYKHQN